MSSWFDGDSMQSFFEFQVGIAFCNRPQRTLYPLATAAVFHSITRTMFRPIPSPLESFFHAPPSRRAQIAKLSSEIQTGINNGAVSAEILLQGDGLSGLC